MKTFIWKYAHLTYACNVDTVEIARNNFNNICRKDFAGKEGIEEKEMAILYTNLRHQLASLFQYPPFFEIF